MGSFSVDLSKFSAKTEGRINLVYRKVGAEIFSRVILKTPVDTGRARANWQTTTSSPATGEVDADDPTGAKATAQAIATCNNWKPMDGSPIVMANNLPYIQALEDGHSKQAPAGMVAITMAEFRGIVEEVVD